MARVGTTKRDVMNFNGGELSPLLYGRTDLDVWPRGCRQLQNMLPRKYGNAERRVGTQFIAATKFPSKRARNVAFDLSSTVSLNIEMGEYYFRFDRSGAPVMNGSVPYEIVHPYPESALSSVMFTQINDVMYVTHPDYPPYKLSHFADNNWTMVQVPFDEPVFKDMNITATTITPSGTTGTITLTASSSLFNAAQVGGYYKLGQIRAANRVELPLTVTGTSASLDLKGDFTVRTSGTWAGTLEIQRYDASTSTWSTIYTHISDQDRNVEAAYKQDDISAQWRMVFTFISKDSASPKAYLESGEAYVYGWAKITAFTSSTSVTAIVEDPFLNTTATATWYEGAWSPYRGYPAACALFQQRMVYSGTYHQPQTIWGSVSNDYQHFEYGTDDDMAFQYTIGSSERLSTQWLCVHNNALIIGTSTGNWAMSGSNGGDDPVTPTNVIIRRQTTTGDAKIRPIVVDNAILHVQRNGEKLYEMTYSIQSYGYDDADITQFAEHITTGGIIDVAYARQPDGIIFGVRSDGVLLACVYDPGQKVIAWSRIVTQGFVESVAVIYGQYGDEVWFVVRRTLGDGSTVRHKERFYPIRRTSTIDCWYSDDARNYSTPAAKNVDAILTVVSTQPASISVAVGGTATFSVAASTNGGDIPFDATYQWLYNGIEVSGATDDEYSFVVDSIDDGGIYSCVVTTRFGSVTSEGAALLVGRYISVTETASLSTTPYFVDETGAIILDSVSESSTLSITPHLTDEENGIISTLDTESATLSITPYFLDEEDA